MNETLDRNQELWNKIKEYDLKDEYFKKIKQWEKENKIYPDTEAWEAVGLPYRIVVQVQIGMKNQY